MTGKRPPYGRRISGNSRGSFGQFEWFKTLDWKVLIVGVLAAVAGFIGAEVMPSLAAMDGASSKVALLVLPFGLRALQQWIKDNSNDTIDTP